MSARRVLLSLIVLLTLLLPEIAASQVNTEKLRRQDSSRGFALDIDLRFGLASGNSEYLLVGTGFRVDHNGDDSRHFLVGNYDFKGTTLERISNNGFLHGRSIWKLSDALAAEGFGQVEFNERLLLNERLLAGAGLRWRIDALRGDGGASPRLSFRIGTGAMYEHERYNTAPAGTETRLLRSTNYVAVYLRLAETVDLTSVSYYQPALSNVADFRSISELTLAITIVHRLSFLVRVNHRYNARPVSGVKPNDIEVNNGISYSLP